MKLFERTRPHRRALTTLCASSALLIALGLAPVAAQVDVRGEGGGALPNIGVEEDAGGGAGSVQPPIGATGGSSGPAAPGGAASGSAAGSGGAALEEPVLREVQLETVAPVDASGLVVGDDTGLAAEPPRAKARVTSASDHEAVRRLQGVTIEGGVQARRNEDPALAARGVRYTSDIIWDSVTVEAPGGVRRLYLDSALRSQVGLTAQPTIPSGERMTATGDIGALLRAGEALAAGEGADGEAGPDGAAGGGAGGPTGAPAANRVAGSATSSPNDNDEAKLARQPALAEAEEELKTPTIITTTEGCAVDIDRDNGVVHQLSKTIVVGEERECAPNGTEFEIKRTTTGCNAEEALEEMRAYPTFTYYYVDDDATRRDISEECERGDADDYYEMRAVTDGCSRVEDLQAMAVFAREKIVYETPQGKLITAADCTVPENAESIATIAAVAQGCSLVDDFDGGFTTQEMRLAYTIDGVEYTAAAGGACREREESVTYPHQRVLCGEEVDVAAGSHALKYKTTITVDGRPQDRTACLIDETTAVGLEKTTDTCESFFSHEVAAERSYGYARYRYTRDGQQAFATACAVDTTAVFTHQISEPISWLQDDAAKQATPRREIFINAYGGRVVVQAASVLSGEPAQAYQFIETAIVSGTPSYDGCTKTTPQVESDRYRRPDTTVYEEETGVEQDPIVANACTVTQTPVWSRQNAVQTSVSGRYCSSWGRNRADDLVCTGQSVTCSYSEEYAGARTLHRDDGLDIVQTSGAVYRMGYASTAVNYGASCPGAPTPPSAWTGAEVNSWNSTEGW